MKNAIYLLLSIILTFVSCSDSDNDQNEYPGPNPQPENPYKTGKDLSSSKQIKWENRGINDDFLMLGYGYDATGKYAHPASLRNKIFDVDKYNADNRGVTLFKYNSSSGGINFSGTKAESLERLASLAGFSKDESVSYKNLFKATFEGTFAYDTSFPNLDYHYLGGSSIATSYLARFIYRENDVAKYLTEQFKSDIEVLSPDEIIKKYGTHLLREVYVGHRIDYLYRANTSDYSTLNSWSGYNAYCYFKIPNSGLTIYKPDSTNPQKENLYIEALYATLPNPNVWMLDITNYQGEPINFDSKMTDESMTLINFSDKALIPIYELIEDVNKKEELRLAYEKYLKE